METTPPAIQDENAQIEERREKLALLRTSQKSAFPNDFVPEQVAEDIHLSLAHKSKEAL